VALACLLVGLVVLSVICLEIYFTPRDTLVSNSPDGDYKIIVREGGRTIDRNFDVVLVDRKTGVERVIFKSFDQTPTIKRERFVWTLDSSKVALIGDRYFVTPEANLANGEIVFLMYDVKSDKVWCNADDDPRYEHISARQAVGIFGKELQREEPLDK
jgi:hypothetical protein